MVRAAVLFVALLCAGIGAGSAYTTFFEFDPAGGTLAAWVARLQSTVPLIGVALFAVQPLAALTTMASAALAYRDRTQFILLALASIALVGAALVTGLGHVPINLQILDWREGALPADALALQAHWWTLHCIRVAALFAAFLALVASAVVPRP